MKLVSLGTHEVVQVLFLWYIASDKPPLCSAVHEVRVTEALPLHPFTIGHEASQPRTHCEHHLVQCSNNKVKIAFFYTNSNVSRNLQEHLDLIGTKYRTLGQSRPSDHLYLTKSKSLCCSVGHGVSFCITYIYSF